MLHAHGNNVKGKSSADALKEANKTMQESIEISILDVVKELKNSDIPVEEQNEIIKNIRRKAQIKMIEIFKEELKGQATQNKP